MVIPFSNTHLRVPKGFQSLLVGLSTEVLRSQPRNIHQFAAEYFEKLLQRRGETQVDPTERQTSLEDRYYNNPSFEHEYRVNDPGVHDAAKKIQTSYRNHRARQRGDNKKHDDAIDADQEDLGYVRQHSTTPTEDPKHKFYDDDDVARHSSGREHDSAPDDIKVESDAEFPQENEEEERQEQERAARIIQARFRGSRATSDEQKSPRSPIADVQRSPRSSDAHEQRYEYGHEKSSSRSSTRFSGKLDSDRHDLRGNLTADDRENSRNEDTDRPRLEREPTQLSEDFERHTQVPRDSAFEREQKTYLDHQEHDMDHSNLDKAATRIQASYRGYRTRKELHSNGSIDHSNQHSYDEYEHGHHTNSSSPTMAQQKDSEFDDDDNAAAVKIQAAFRGYRARKDLEK